jgi:hypothetical protein
MYHTYHVQAIIERRFKADSVVSRPIRIYRHRHLLNEPQIASIPAVCPPFHKKRKRKLAVLTKSKQIRQLKDNPAKKCNIASQSQNQKSPSEANFKRNAISPLYQRISA